MSKVAEASWRAYRRVTGFFADFSSVCRCVDSMKMGIGAVAPVKSEINTEAVKSEINTEAPPMIVAQELRSPGKSAQ